MCCCGRDGRADWSMVEVLSCGTSVALLESHPVRTRSEIYRFDLESLMTLEADHGGRMNAARMREYAWPHDRGMDLPWDYLYHSVG